MIRQILGEVSVPVANTEVQQVIENPGIVKTYLEKYMPSLISFLVQLVVAIVILLIGIKVIKSVVKIIKKGFDKSRMDAAVASFLANLIKYFLYFVLVAGQPVEFRRRRAYSFDEAVWRGRLHS